MKTRLFYAVLMLFVLFGCAAAPKRGAVATPVPEQKAEPQASPTAPAPETMASPALQKETLNMILFTDDALSHGIKCGDRRIIKKEVLGQTPAQGPSGSWTERWTLYRCGTLLRYKVFYASGKKGTAYFTVKVEK